MIGRPSRKSGTLDTLKPHSRRRRASATMAQFAEDAAVIARNTYGPDVELAQRMADFARRRVAEDDKHIAEFLQELAELKRPRRRRLS